MKIDVHCHCYPQEYVGELAKSGLTIITPGSNPMHLWEGVEERLVVMREAQVDLEVLSVPAPSAFFPDIELSVNLAQICNDTLSEMCGNHLDHFRGLITLPLTDVGAAIDELHRARRKPGMVGVMMGTNIAGKPLDSPEFLPFYAELDRLRLPVFIHPMDPVDMPLTRVYRLTANIAFLFETCLAATRLILGGVREKYPNFPVILCHLGGVIPFISDRIDHAARRYEETRKNISAPPSEYYRQMYFDTAMSYGEGPMTCAHHYLGDDQILLGTDYPFTKAEHMRVVPGIGSLDLAPETKEKIFWKNANRIFGIVS